MRKLLLLPIFCFSLCIFAETSDTTLTALQLINRIELKSQAVDAVLPQINILLKKGEKAQAKALVEESLAQIAQIETDQQQLLLISPDIREDQILLSQTQETKRYLTSKANILRNAITVYIRCEAKLFADNFDTFKEEIEGGLSEWGVSFLDDAKAADWSVTITAKAREFRKTDFDGVSTYYSYVDAKICIDKPSTGQRVYENKFTQKGGHTYNFEQAAREAYEDIVPMLNNIIIAHISQ